MAEGYVIGVDLGGTKLLAGAVGADLSVIHRTNRLVYGLSQDELVQMIADAMDEIRTAIGAPIEAIGFGIPLAFPGTRLDRTLSITLALGIVGSAYISETIRAGIQSVPRGQREAARNTGPGGRAPRPHAGAHLHAHRRLSGRSHQQCESR